MATKKKLTGLEKKFLEAAKEASPLIQEELAKAEMAIAAAIDIAEEHGIPFSASLSSGALTNEYVPESFEEKKFSEIDDLYELVEGHDLDIMVYGNGYAGWQQSYC